jgi:hypothetical protein
MTTALIKRITLTVFLLAAASGCEFVNFDNPIPPPTGDDPGGGTNDSGAPTGPAPLLPFKPGNVWAYWVTNLDGSRFVKYIMIDEKPTMVGGVGLHQNDMAYPVRTKGSMEGPAYLVTMQQKVGEQIVNYREETFDQLGQMVLDINWEPQQLELDQSTERTRAGASWMESYTEIARPLGGIPQTKQQNEPWTVVGPETLSLSGFPMPFQTVVFRKGAVMTTADAGGGDASDAGKADGGIRPPTLTSESPSAADGGDAGGTNPNMPKTLWYARGVGKIKEAGGGQPTEELTYYSLK